MSEARVVERDPSARAEGCPDPEDSAYFPLRYYVEFLEMLADRPDRFEVLTYADLPWADDYDYREHYPVELRNWKRDLASGRRDKRKIHVILQHDVDSQPHRTHAMLREEQRLGLRSNVMIFNRRINRRHLQKTGELLYTDYALDHAYLNQLQNDHGFVIAYHGNAYEQAMFDEAEALAVFERDVAALRDRGYDIGFFSPHGGPRGPDGRTSNCLDIPDSLSRSIRWVANKQTVRVTSSYSDGGINSKNRNPDERDLRDFVSAWKPGGRYRVLTHPQYYGPEARPSPRMIQAAWYRDLLDTCRAHPEARLWGDVAERF